MIFLLSVLSALTVFASVEYYRQLMKVRREYKKAKEVIDDIILSFNSQLNRQTEELERLAYKIEASSSKSEKALSGVEENKGLLKSLELKLTSLLEDKKKLQEKTNEIKKRLHDVSVLQETLTKKISSMPEHAWKIPVISEEGTETVIPIKREKALSPLTETELTVLEILTTEGPKTAPEIKERIKLSREHTARLMKKLYEEGYLERDTNKIPFKYRVKKEMEDLLKRKSS